MDSNKYTFSILIALSLLVGVYIVLSDTLVLMANSYKNIKSLKNNESQNITITGRYLIVNLTTVNNLTLKKGPPVITKGSGGIGNQLFEFACAYAVAKQRNSDVYVVNRMLNLTTPKDHHHFSMERSFCLDHFKIPFSGYTNDTGKGEIFDFREQHIWEKSIPRWKPARVNDVCGSEIYFKPFREEIKKLFTLDIDERPIKSILQQVEGAESIAVHIRRGDYSNKTDNRTIPITFQKRAMKWMKKMVSSNATFFIFSDDMDFVRREFQLIPNVVYVDNSKSAMASLYDFLIMSRCKHNIIANSTFSWWAAYLNRNKDKIVIGPFPRHPPGWNEWKYKDKNILKYRELIFDHYLYPADWITINPFLEDEL